MTITKEQIENHGLKLEEYKKIKELLGRDTNLQKFILRNFQQKIILLSKDQAKMQV